MKKHWKWLAGLLGLALLAPFASRKPDAIQNLLGLPGGAGTVLKALWGTAVTAFVMVLLLKLVQSAGNRRP